jgi:hypothetical protein
MSTTMMQMEAARGEAVVARDVGLVGRVIVTWGVAGGLALGGFLVAGMTLAGRLSGNALLTTSLVLYLIGALLGLVHGVALAYFGRPAGMTPRQAFGRLGMGLLYAIPALIVGFLAAGWIAMSSVALYLGRTLPVVGAGIGWLVGAVLVLVAALSGLEALRHAYARWEDRRLGTVLVAGTFAALLVLFLADRPELWGTRFRVTEVGAVLLAAVGAFWIAGPVVTLALWLQRLLPGRRLAVGFQGQARPWLSLVIGLAAGGLLALLALPFKQAAFAMAPVGPLGGVVQGLSRALVDEVLLRLFLVTGTVWVLMRWNATSRPMAAALGVLAAAFVQALLYLPGVNAIGFASPATAAGYLVATVLLPALVFGALFWKRGFATALLAHATALMAVMLMI